MERASEGERETESEKEGRREEGGVTRAVPFESCSCKRGNLRVASVQAVSSLLFHTHIYIYIYIYMCVVRLNDAFRMKSSQGLT